MDPNPAASNPIPIQSAGSSCFAASVSCSRKKISAPAMMPMGTLTKKHQFHV